MVCQLWAVSALLVAFAWPTTPASAAAGSALHVTVDAGHGGSEIGASYRFTDGTVLREKDVNLQVAIQLGRMLKAAGDVVTYTRTSDTPLNVRRRDLNGDGQVSLADELQARVDAANSAGSDLFVSVCFDGSSDPSVRGTQTFWDPKRSFSSQNRALAQAVQHAIVSSLTSAGYPTRDRGATADTSLLNGDSFFLLGPASSIVARPSNMPAIIGEPLFLTNRADATALRNPSIITAVARGFFKGIQASGLTGAR
jgi:N-acetylmuramoyl-L-alanine amidase